MSKNPVSETPLLDALRADPNRVTTEEVIIFHGVPVYSFWSMPKGSLKAESFKPCCYGWVKNRNRG